MPRMLRFARRSATPEWLAALSVFGLVVVLDLGWTRAGLGSSTSPYYEQYGAALRDGRLWLSLVDANGQCPWDLGVFEGKCFAYWGPFPALIHAALPMLSDRLVTVIAAGFAAFFLTKLVLQLSRPFLPMSALRLAPSLIGLMNAGAFVAVAVVARIYEEAILIAVALGLAGLWWLARAWSQDANVELRSTAGPVRRYLPGLVLLTLAGTTRLPWIGCAGLATLYCLWRLHQSGALRASRVGALCAPVVIGALLLGGINYARFHDPFDTGVDRGAFNSSLLALGILPMSVRNIPMNFLIYWFAAWPPPSNPLAAVAPPSEATFFPWTSYFATRIGVWELPLAGFVAMPQMLLALTRWRRPSLRSETLAVAVSTLPVAAAVMMMRGSIYRYQMEALLPGLLLLMPLCLEQARSCSSRGLKCLWGLTLVGTFVTAINLVWIVRKLCEWWKCC